MFPAALSLVMGGIYLLAQHGAERAERMRSLSVQSSGYYFDRGRSSSASAYGALEMKPKDQQPGGAAV